MANTFAVSLVTPEKLVLEADAVYADLPAHDGQLGVLAHRAAMLLKLGVGKLRLDLADGKTLRYVLDGGFAQMQANKLTLLCERAYAAGDLDAAEAQRRLQEAESMPSTGGADVIEKRNRALAVARHLVTSVG